MRARTRPAGARALFGGQILAADSLATMTETTQSADRGYGLGTGIYHLDGHMVFGHDGRITGYGASLRHVPTSGLTVVVLANQDTFATRPFANQLVAEASRPPSSD